MYVRVCVRVCVFVCMYVIEIERGEADRYGQKELGKHGYSDRTARITGRG